MKDKNPLFILKEEVAYYMIRKIKIANGKVLIEMRSHLGRKSNISNAKITFPKDCKNILW